MMMKLGFMLAILLRVFVKIESKCTKGCDLALGSYYLTQGDTLGAIAGYFGATVSDVVSYNPSIIDPNSIPMGTRINVPFSCDCIDGSFLGHVFKYQVQSGDTFTSIAELSFANLTTPSWIERFNGYNSSRKVPVVGRSVNVTVNCSCGSSSVSVEYGLFITFPLVSGDSLSFMAQLTGVSASLLKKYNPGVDFNAGSGLVYVPGKDRNGSYRPLISGSSPDGMQGSSPGVSRSPGVSSGLVVGVCVAVGLIALLGCLYFGCLIGKRRKEALLSDKPAMQLTQPVLKHEGMSAIPGITVDKSVEFSYSELVNATNNFSVALKIGQGGFGTVYYAELRGEKAAIKKMDMLATKSFLAELKVLTHVHHLNLVRLIGYCVGHSLFIVYEYIENGNLSEHLRGSGKAVLPWTTRVQIALDSARGLEYIHEQTVPVYIHRDIKSPNILIDSNFRAKVADFGLTKLVEVGNVSLPTGLQGTFGYMPPEYAQFGEVSSKIDVYAFGVVLYELISGKEAVVKENNLTSEPTALVSLFKCVLKEADPTAICQLVDPRLGENYPLDSVMKMAQLARECTRKNPELRPTMRSVVVDLLGLSSTTNNWHIGPLYEHGVQNLVSGR